MSSATNVRQKDEIDTTNVKFWYPELDKDGQIKGWKIDHKKYLNFIRLLGYRRFDQGNDFFFVLIKDKVIDIVAKHRIKDEVINYINQLPDGFLKKDGIRKDELLGKFYTSPGIYFSEIKFSLLMPEPDLILNQDTKEESFIYYKNGFVVCTAYGYELKDYNKLDKYIWKNQIKDRAFRKDDPEGMFHKFAYNISGQKEGRFQALKTLIGYNLHSYFDTKLKAINLTDSSISDSAEGRTGKTLLGRSVEKIKNLCEISGKDFDPTNKHKYQNCRLDTQIVFLNDIKKNFRFECLFNDISDHITVDQKNMQPFNIQAKILISSNDTFRVEGGSAKDRLIEFELSEHYSRNYSPYDEFGHWFFTEWDESEWVAFDNFMMSCICDYLRLGVIEAEPINLGKRKQMEHTNPDFVAWMNEQLEKKEIKFGFDYGKREKHADFLNCYTDYREDKWLKKQANFTKYIKTFVLNSDEFKAKVIERRADGIDYFRLQEDIFVNGEEKELRYTPINADLPY